MNLDYACFDTMDPYGILAANVRRTIDDIISFMLDYSMKNEFQERIRTIYNFMNQLNTDFQ